MANRRLSMRKIKEVLRLTHDGKLSERQVAQSLNLSRSTVKDYRARAHRAGLSWPLPETLSEETVEQKLFPPASSIEPSAEALPDFEYVYRELKAHRKFNLTRDLLWQEYKEQHPEGYQYSRFCGLYRRYRAKLDYCMRQDHRGGEKLFVDYGEGLPLVDPRLMSRSRPSFLSQSGRFQLHLCRSHSEPTTSRLDRLPCQGVFLLWLCTQDRGPRLLEERGQPSLLLRARVKPDLCGNGQPLRDLCLTGRQPVPGTKRK